MAKKKEIADESKPTLKLEGYLYQTRFYKTLDLLRNRTFNEKDKPVKLYSKVE